MVDISKMVNIQKTVMIWVDAEDWYKDAEEKEKQKMFDLLVEDGFSYTEAEDLTEAFELVNSFKNNNFLQQKVVIALSNFNEKENITALNELIMKIKRL